MYNFKRKRGQFGGEISSCDVIMHKGHSPLLLGTDHLISETAGIGGRVGQFLRSKIFFSLLVFRGIFSATSPSVRVFFTSTYILIERFSYDLEKWFR